MICTSTSNYNSKGKFATWKQILQAGIGVFKPFILYTPVNIINFFNPDAIIILEHSFYLSQQDDPQPVSSAAQKYIASDIPARVGKALKDVFKQYNKASEDGKLDMVLKVIIQNHMGELNIHFDTLSIDNSIPDTTAAK